MPKSARFAAFAGLAWGLALGCGEHTDKPPRLGPGPCPDHRVTLDCESEVRYQGIKAEGSVHVLDIAGASAAFTDTALRKVNGQLEGFIASQTRLCRDYNSCIAEPAEYLAEARRAREHMQGITPLVTQLNAGEAAAADGLLSAAGIRPTGPALEISVNLDAVLPDSTGGGQKIVPPNFPLPTGSKVAFNFIVNQPAYVYLFQIDPEKKVSVLFPDDRIATKNPLPAGRPVQIPENGLRYRLDERNIGTENVYFAVSVRPLTALEQTLKRYASGQVQQVSQDALMADMAAMKPGSVAADCPKTRDLVLVADASSQPAASSGGDICPKTRGLVLDVAPQPNQPVAHSIHARAAAGDNVIVKFFPFQHVTEQQFTGKITEYNAGGAAGVKTRGISIEGFR